MKSGSKQRGGTVQRVRLDAEDSAMMDYLHGEVKGGKGQSLAASHYEYARESEILRRLAHAWQVKNEVKMKALQDEVHDSHGYRPLSTPWNLLWRTPCFPSQPWNALDGDIRRYIMAVMFISDTETIEPLQTLSVANLRGRNSYAVQAHHEWKVAFRSGEESPPPAIFRKEDGEVVALLRMDFTKTKTELCHQFEAWLELPENKRSLELHSKHGSNTHAVSGKPLDGLKALAIRRLLERNDNNWIEANAFADANRKCGKAFHAAKPGRGKGGSPVHKRELGSDETFFNDALQRSKDYQAKLFPWEIGPSNMFAEQFEKVLKNLLSAANQ